jgi:hypothetical protein
VGMGGVGERSTLIKAYISSTFSVTVFHFIIIVKLFMCSWPFISSSNVQGVFDLIQ